MGAAAYLDLPRIRDAAVDRAISASRSQLGGHLGAGLPMGSVHVDTQLTGHKLLAPERPGIPITAWGNGCIGKAGNLTVLGTVLVRFRYHSHVIGQVAVVLNGYAGRRCR